MKKVVQSEELGASKRGRPVKDTDSQPSPSATDGAVSAISTPTPHIIPTSSNQDSPPLDGDQAPPPTLLFLFPALRPPSPHNIVQIYPHPLSATPVDTNQTDDQGRPMDAKYYSPTPLPADRSLFDPNPATLHQHHHYSGNYEMQLVPPTTRSARAAELFELPPPLEGDQTISCHQCKQRKSPVHDVVFRCCLKLRPRRVGGKPETWQQLACDKAFCISCLLRHTPDAVPLTHLPDVPHHRSVTRGDSWVCPHCLDLCSCTGCVDKRTKRHSVLDNDTPTGRPQYGNYTIKLVKFLKSFNLFGLPSENSDAFYPCERFTVIIDRKNHRLSEFLDWTPGRPMPFEAPLLPAGFYPRPGSRKHALPTHFIPMEPPDILTVQRYHKHFRNYLEDGVTLAPTPAGLNPSPTYCNTQPAPFPQPLPLDNDYPDGPNVVDDDSFHPLLVDDSNSQDSPNASDHSVHDGSNPPTQLPSPLPDPVILLPAQQQRRPRRHHDDTDALDLPVALNAVKRRTRLPSNSHSNQQVQLTITQPSIPPPPSNSQNSPTLSSQHQQQDLQQLPTELPQSARSSGNNLASPINQMPAVYNLPQNHVHIDLTLFQSRSQSGLPRSGRTSSVLGLPVDGQSTSSTHNNNNHLPALDANPNHAMTNNISINTISSNINNNNSINSINNFMNSANNSIPKDHPLQLAYSNPHLQQPTSTAQSHLTLNPPIHANQTLQLHTSDSTNLANFAALPMSSSITSLTSGSLGPAFPARPTFAPQPHRHRNAPPPHPSASVVSPPYNPGPSTLSPPSAQFSQPPPLVRNAMGISSASGSASTSSSSVGAFGHPFANLRLPNNLSTSNSSGFNLNQLSTLLSASNYKPSNPPPAPLASPAHRSPPFFPTSQSLQQLPQHQPQHQHQQHPQHPQPQQQQHQQPQHHSHQHQQPQHQHQLHPQQQQHQQHPPHPQHPQHQQQQQQPQHQQHHHPQLPQHQSHHQQQQQQQQQHHHVAHAFQPSLQHQSTMLISHHQQQQQHQQQSAHPAHSLVSAGRSSINQHHTLLPQSQHFPHQTSFQYNNSLPSLHPTQQQPPLHRFTPSFHPPATAATINSTPNLSLSSSILPASNPPGLYSVVATLHGSSTQTQNHQQPPQPAQQPQQGIFSHPPNLHSNLQPFPNQSFTFTGSTPLSSRPLPHGGTLPVLSLDHSLLHQFKSLDPSPQQQFR